MELFSNIRLHYFQDGTFSPISDDEGDVGDRLRYTDNVAHEVLETERAYVHDLGVVIQVSPPNLSALKFQSSHSDVEHHGAQVHGCQFATDPSC